MLLSYVLNISSTATLLTRSLLLVYIHRCTFADVPSAGQDTISAVAEVCRWLHTTDVRMAFAGTKDKRGVTSQLCTAFRVRERGASRGELREGRERGEGERWGEAEGYRESKCHRDRETQKVGSERCR